MKRIRKKSEIKKSKNPIAPSLQKDAQAAQILQKMENISQGTGSWLKDMLKMFLAFCIFFILAGAIISIFFQGTLKPSWSWEMNEEPLAKNVPLQIRDGEIYRYEIRANETAQNATIEASAYFGCPGIYLKDASRLEPGQKPFVVCLSNDGVELSPEGKRIGSNISFANGTMPYFQGWMLALNDSFDWHANMTFVVQPFNITKVQKLRWKVIGSTNYLGREAYDVRISSEGGSENNQLAPSNGLERPIRLLVDKKKRVLLYLESSSFNISIAKAPFELANGKVREG